MTGDAPAQGPLEPGVTVLANLAVDRIDGRAPSPGGCASFAGQALDLFGRGRIVAQAAPADLALFDGILGAGPSGPVEVLPAAVTNGFGMHYDGDARVMTVDAVGPTWTPAVIAAAAPRTTWVHVSPLLRGEFPAASLRALAAAGHRVAFDGQGLVRVPQAGPLRSDAAYDPALLASMAVLKLADDEAAVLTGGAPFGLTDAAALGVAEILVTAGSKGCTVFAGGEAHHVAAAWPVPGVHATGAGDLFTVSYVAARARGDAPVAAAQVASRLVSELLQVRLESGS